MTLIKNSKFKNIFRGQKGEQKNVLAENYNPIQYPYIGMGNPDSNLLLVGAEKGFNPSEYPEITKHELNLNYIHWQDILLNHNNLNDQLHPRLKLREGLTGFNPFSPMTLDITCNKVYPKNGHTYKMMEKTINNSLMMFHAMNQKSIFQVSPTFYQESVFNYCFLTELSDLPKNSSKDGKSFSHEYFTKSERYNHLKGSLGDFYRGFDTIVIYAGKKYTGNHGSHQREEIIRLFNPNLNIEDLKYDQMGDNNKWLFDVYESALGGAKVIVCRHLTSVGTTEFDIGHLLGTIGIGAINYN